MKRTNRRCSSRPLRRVGLGIALLCCGALAGPASASALQAVAPDGSVLVAWGDVEVTRIDPDGVPSGVIYDVAPEPQLPEGPDQTENSHLTNMAIAPDGVVTLVWLDIVEWDARIMTRRLAPDGTPLGEPVAIATGQEIHITPKLGIGPDGTATVTWARFSGPSNEAVMRRIAPDGTPEEGTQVLSAPGASVSRLAAAMAPDGTATVVWSQAGEGESDLLMERRVAPDGTPAPATHQLGEASWSIGDPEVEVADDGTAAVLWDQTDSNDPELWTRRVEPDGSPEPSGHLLEEGEDLAFADLALAPDGTALVTWGLEYNHWRSALIGADGTPAAPRPVTVAGVALAGWPRVAVTPDDDFVLAWVDFCGTKECLLAGNIDEDGEIAAPAKLDEGGAIGGQGGIFLPDGTGSFLWGQSFSSTWSHGALRTRRLSPDGTLGPIYDLVEADPSPTASTYLKEVSFGDLPVGSSARHDVPLFVGSYEPLGTFSVAVAGPDANRFQVDDGTCGREAVLPANCHVFVSFAPVASGPAAAELVIDAGEHGAPLVLPLSGVGTEPVREPPIPTPLPTPLPPPALQVQLGRPVMDSSSGTATLPIAVPAAGTVHVSGPCVGGSAEARSARVAAAGTVAVEVVARARCRRQLLRTGTTRFAVAVTFIAADGQTTVDHRPVRLRLAR